MDLGRAVLTPREMAMWATDVKEILSTPELAEALEDPERVGNQDETSLYVGTRLLLHLMTDWLTNWLMNVHYNLETRQKKFFFLKTLKKLKKP